MRNSVARKLTVLLLTITLLFSAQVAWAARVPDVDSTQKIVDLADLLTDSEESDLAAEIVAATAASGMDFVFFSYSDNSVTDLQQYAEDFYDFNGYGIGSEYDGVLMYINMGTRDVDMIVCGRPNAVFTASVQNSVMNEVIPHLSEGDFYAGASLFVQETAGYMLRADAATVDQNYAELERQLDRQGKMPVGQALLFSFLIAAAIIGILALRQRSSMKSAPALQTYFSAEGMRLTLSRDTFLSTHTTKTPIPKNTSSGGSSGGAHRSSSGKTFSGGGGRKF